MAWPIRPTNPRRGLTLIEALLAGVVLSICVVGVCGQLSVSYQQTIVLNQNATALALAGQLLDEIASKPLLDPTTNSTTPVTSPMSGPRSAFTGAGDYNLYTDTGSELTTLAGATVNATAGQAYTRSVTVQSGAMPSGDTGSPSGDFAVATVTVKTPSGQTVQLQRILTNYTFTR